jgi:hypothetical protein
VGRLYAPAGKFYRYRRELTGGLNRGKGELLGGLVRGGELGGSNGRGRELYGLTGRLGGFPGENEAWDDPREERECSTGRGNTWEGSTGGSEAWEGPQEQYCSSYNRKKPSYGFRPVLYI